MGIAINYYRPLLKAEPTIKLTKREQEVVELICEGRSMNEVAAILYLSPSTIISHKRQLFRKFGINSLVRLGVLAERYGFTKY